jgi:hypothetical protein
VKHLNNRLLLTCSILLSCPTFVSSKPATETLKGWLSDSSCSKNRASEGLFTATNASCAKECVSKGEKIVLIDPEHKKIVDIANQDAVKKNVSDYVELTGTVDAKNLFHVDSVKFLDKNRAMCGVPQKTPSKKE